MIELIEILQDERKIRKKCGKKYNIISEKGMEYLSVLYFNFCCKELKWKMEDEYRLVFANCEVQTSNGKLVPYKKLNIIPKKIFIGNNCLEKDKKKLEEIAKHLKMEYAYR